MFIQCLFRHIRLHFCFLFLEWQQLGETAARGVKGVVLEAFGAGNMPDNPEHHWLPWLKEQREAGLQVRAQFAACAICVWSLSTPVTCCLWHCLHACNLMQSWLLLQVYLSSQCLKGELRVCWLTRSALSSLLLLRICISGQELARACRRATA